MVRIAGVRRIRRALLPGGWVGALTPPNRIDLRQTCASGREAQVAASGSVGGARSVQRRRGDFRGGGRAPSARSREACSASASISAPISATSGCTSTRRPNSRAVSAVFGPRQATIDRECGLPAMPTRFRTVDDEVKQTASNPPVLIASADRRGRRRGPHRPVGGDVVDLPAALPQPLGQRLGGDVGPRQQHPVDRVEHVVVLREAWPAARPTTAGRPRSARE